MGLHTRFPKFLARLLPILFLQSNSTNIFHLDMTQPQYPTFNREQTYIIVQFYNFNFMKTMNILYLNMYKQKQIMVLKYNIILGSVVFTIYIMQVMY